MFEQRIFVNLAVEALHAFHRAGDEKFKEVSYLQYPHRHTFNFKVELRVTHDDRDVEFIMFKHEIEKYLVTKYFSKELGMCDFTGKSCEMLAKEIIEYCIGKGYSPEEVWVDEDGENGAHVIHDRGAVAAIAPRPPSTQLAMPFDLGQVASVSKRDEKAGLGKIILVVGYTGSGKSTLSNVLAQVTGLPILEISTLIQNIKSYVKRNGHDKDRTALSTSISSSELAVEVDEYIDIERGNSIIISGLRDSETYRMLLEKYGKEHFQIIKMNVSPEVCANRLKQNIHDYMQDGGIIDAKLGVSYIMDDAAIVYPNK